MESCFPDFVLGIDIQIIKKQQPSLVLDASILKSGLYLVWCFNDKVDTHKQTSYIQTIFSLTYPEEEVGSCGT